MSLKRSVRLCSSSERQFLRTQWLQSGQCARCFHASIRQRAEFVDGNDQGTPYNAPKRGPTRHERSAKISNELSMLQKGPPPSGDSTGPGSASGTYHPPPQAPTSSAGFLETPNQMSGPTRMGENVSAGREGPNAQGVGRPIRYEDRGDAPQDTTNLARGIRAPGQVEEPAEGGASVLGNDRVTTGHHQQWLDRTSRDGTPWNARQARTLQQKVSSSAASGVPIRPKSWHPNALLHHNIGGSTIAAQNFTGVIRDRLTNLTIPSRVGQQPKSHRKLLPVAKDFVVDKFVRGTYDATNAFGGEKYKQATLNDVARYTMLNGTLSPKDGERVLRKVRGLLPAAPTTQKARTGKQPA